MSLCITNSFKKYPQNFYFQKDFKTIVKLCFSGNLISSPFKERKTTLSGIELKFICKTSTPPKLN